jgi:WD40 repeat protein
MENVQKSSEDIQTGKKSIFSIKPNKLKADFITGTYYMIKMNKKFLIFLNGKQNNELYIYKLNDTLTLGSLKLKEPINYFDFHNKYDTIFSVATGNDILIYNIDVEKNLINELSKIQGHFSKVTFTEFSPFDPNILLSICGNSDIKIFELNSTMSKNHIFFDEQFVDEKIRWSISRIGVISKDRKKILISSQNNFSKKGVTVKLLKDEIEDFYFYDNDDDYIIVITKKDVIYLEKKRRQINLSNKR